MMGSSEAERRHNQWQQNYDKLHEEMDFAMKIFIESKKCNCKVYVGVHIPDYKICRHWVKERDRVFGKRIDESFNQIIPNGILTMKEMGFDMDKVSITFQKESPKE